MDDITRLSAEIADVKSDLAELKRDFTENKQERRLEIAELRSDVKQLLAFANMGQGFLWTIFRIGAVVAAVGVAAGWLWDHISWK